MNLDDRAPALPHGETHAGAAAAQAPPKRTWVPIRSIGPRHRERILGHLLLLDAQSRYLRFGFSASDAQIRRYVDSLDFQQDEVLGIFNRRLELIALAHVAYRAADPDRNREATAEFGVSVLPQARRRGFGRRLFDHASLHARNRGVRLFYIHALSENTAMLKIARDAGAAIEREGSESEAWLRLPPDSFSSHLDQLIGDRAAELDYQLKVYSRNVDAALEERSTARTGDG